MLKANSRWQVKDIDKSKADILARSLGISPIIAALLVGRGLTEVDQAADFLHTNEGTCHDPMLMDGMKETAERIQRAINGNEKILIFGDYDADGVSSTSLMVRALRAMAADVSYYVPNRFTEGYGPNKPALEAAKSKGIDLVITVDTGISACEEADYAKALGLDYIITDHHEPPPILPEAYSIINPKKPGCHYPFKSLAGVGVAFKLIQALKGGELPHELLSLAAIGTISDLVPLIDENRLIASWGLNEINKGSYIGIEALTAVCGIDNGLVDADHIGFGIGPRLNAAGRMDHAGPAVDLMLSDDPVEAGELAGMLDNLNSERKTIVDQMTAEASDMAEALSKSGQSVFVIAGHDWHAGVIGITASRIVEKYYRPTIILAIDSETGLAKGSARSIEGFDIFEALSSCRDILPHFGGHPMAAGMTLKADDLPQLQERLNEFAKHVLTEDILTPVTAVDVDCCVENINLELIETLNKLAPFGVANPKPQFVVRDTAFSQMKQIGRDNNHIKIVFENNGAKLDGVGFRMGDKYNHITPDALISAVGELSINEWNGFRKPQLMIRDLSVNGWQLFDLRNEQKLIQRIRQLPESKRVIIAFQSDTVDQLGLKELKDEVKDAKDITPSLIENSYIILLDLPDHKANLEMLLQNGAFPERIYTVFHHNDENYFSSFPTRDHFKWLYGLINKQQPFHLEQMLNKIARHKGWHPDMIKFMAEVFFDLDFVKIDDGVVTINKESGKQPLTASKAYQKKQEKMELEDILCYSSYQSLKTWLDRKLVDGERPEEACT
ncbi:exonuclease RecJ [Scopulibacillus darangshiensis]|uniref:Single-stranded-DNA-specific exonuclease RecJ n=1 Tax=Scopulibacillus darangshiensis TaxID=442528 RepID=A0A4R2PCV0_9BACL|nr:single-stranded-DNA-specific exonuclease RecJ [Scopulibacillus darangshiensis]TCP32268.1 exonuclease RecJ [Scopulibacillus darangshiensis]